MRKILERCFKNLKSNLYETRGDHLRSFILPVRGLEHFGATYISIPFTKTYYHTFKESSGKAIFDRSTLILKKIIWDNGNISY